MHAPTHGVRLALPLVLMLALAPPGRTEEDGPAAAGNFVQVVLQGLTLGPAHVTDELIVFPLLAKEAPKPLDLVPSPLARAVGYAEPTFPKRRFDLAVTNDEAKPLLLLGGTVLEGGWRDRVVRRDVLVPVDTQLEIETVVAAPATDHRDAPAPFELGSALAPAFVRQRADFSPSHNLVPTFTRHFLEFRNEGDARRSLSALHESEQLARLCIACHESLAAFPALGGGRVVGLVTAVRGRIGSCEIFGDNRTFTAWFEPLLKSHSFASAAILAKARRLRLRLPDEESAEATLGRLERDAQALLDQLRKATYREGDAPKGSMGEYLLLRTAGWARGAAVGLDGRLVHLTVFPHDPFENALFASRVRAPEDEQDLPGAGEMERRGGHGRLTEFERRLLERMREHRGGGGLRR